MRAVAVYRTFFVYYNACYCCLRCQPMFVISILGCRYMYMYVPDTSVGTEGGGRRGGWLGLGGLQPPPPPPLFLEGGHLLPSIVTTQTF